MELLKFILELYNIQKYSSKIKKIVLGMDDIIISIEYTCGSIRRRWTFNPNTRSFTRITQATVFGDLQPQGFNEKCPTCKDVRS